MYPLDETDRPYFNSRANIGAISLNLPMIYMKAKEENKNFYEVLDYYLEMIRQLHLRAYDYIGKMKASSNPLAFEQGGIDGGFLKPDDEIAPLLKSMTASFGITALNELTELHQQTSLLEDSSFALEVLTYINEKVDGFKKEDGRLYAVYGSPAESLCGKQCEQFKKKYGEVENVTTRGFFSNSFHMGVWEDIDPITKQLAEFPFWKLSAGGHIQYVRYYNNHNIEAMKSVIRHGMKFGFYQGTNLALSYCDDCGYQGIDFETCPTCGSDEVTKIDRLCGYIGYSKVKGTTRMNEAKLKEIQEYRLSM